MAFGRRWVACECYRVVHVSSKVWFTSDVRKNSVILSGAQCVGVEQTLKPGLLPHCQHSRWPDRSITNIL